jgi:imidazolonepropionase-like amidohydrolase
MTMILRLWLSLTLLTSWATAAGGGETLLHAGHLLDVRSGAVVEERTVVVRDGRIAEIREGFVAGGADDTVIDLRDHWVLPGLMDMHTHLTTEGHRDIYLERFRIETAEWAIRSVAYARTTLMSGFTTVRDLGDRDNVSVALRRSVEAGVVPGPRIFTAAKSLATTGGHADPTNGTKESLRGDPGPKDGVVNGVDDARKAVRQRYKEGADLIKITATGGVLSLARNSQTPQFTEEEIRAIVETAADYGFHVAAHAHGAEGMKRAVRGGVRSIEHGTYMDRETMDLMKRHGTYFVPTILAGKTVAEKSRIDGYYPDVVRPKAAAVGPKIQSTFAEAYAAGVKIAFGTDSGVSVHGENAREFVYMVEAGMPAMEAIRSATLNTAELLGIEADLGTIETGKIADIIAVAADPVADVTTLQDVRFVMKEGVVYKLTGTDARGARP